MATTAESTNTGVNLERELVCFICTEILYQPLTIFDCLHTFCGSCLKEWFSHQHRKARSSHSSSSSSSPYTCPTCRGVVKQVQRNAMVNTFLEMFLRANPGRCRSEEEKREIAQVYKPGDDIMPKVESRRRERRGRREGGSTDAREQRMIEEAQERSLRDIRNNQPPAQESLQLPSTARQDQSSRSREREQRRERRREQNRQGHRQQTQADEGRRTPGETEDVEQRRRESTSAPVPASSPRHPEAVEARQRQQTVVHQASLASLISSSDHGTGSSGSDSLADTNAIMQEILAEGLGLLDGVDVDALTETEQDALAERIAEAYRQRVRARNQRNNPSSESVANQQSAANNQVSNTLQVDDNRRRRREGSGSRTRRADTMPVIAAEPVAADRPQPARTSPTDTSNSLPPPSSVVLTHRPRASSHGQRRDQSYNATRQVSPSRRTADTRSQSATEITNRSQSQDQANVRSQASASTDQRPAIDSGGKPQSAEAPIHARRQPASSNEPYNGATELPAASSSQRDHSPGQSVPEPISSDSRSPRLATQISAQTTGNLGRRTSGLFDEPSVSCFRCHRSDIQYEVYRHCDKCDITLCLQCYRSGRGCKHWYGFGHAAMARFESSQPDSHQQIELPHLLQTGRQYKKPEQHTIIRSKLAKDGTTIIPLQTTSDPTTRFQEGRFCDRCQTFASACYWSCDYCNYGEWGFCRDCVNSHHCCTHPLLASAHKSYAPVSPTMRSAVDNGNPTASDLLSAKLRPSPMNSQPSSATSVVSAGAGPFPDFINLVITTHCDICSLPIPPSSHRFHCPSHPSPTPTNPDAKGDYDICTPCYQNLVKTNRIKRDDGSAGWRKCPSGHRMIITTFHADSDGGQRRVVINDLVGGWKTPEEAMRDWNAELDARREQGGSYESPISPPTASSPDGISARRFVRVRTGSSSIDPISPTSASTFVTNSRFPPDGGVGLRGVAWWSYFPDDGDRGPQDLLFPSGAEIRELKIDEEYPDWCGGVYAGDRGLLPTSYVRI